ncbi:la-related protein 6-like [Panulirus ornatus]|uniref:la-related protein 6-like n=1 Tax=Panulirus ornatus TaxID=150431 RepID=UPI003A83E76C
MLSLLSRIVTGGDCEECQAPEEDAVPSVTSSVVDDTDEEKSGPTMPVININQAELAEDALHVHKETKHVPATRSDSSEDTGEDSTFEKDVEAPLVIPSKDVCCRILELVEYYLSDQNLVKDMFILKHVTKHSEGYVSLKLLTSYKKVKRITKDWRVVAHSLRDSNTLQLNEEGTKVRRRKVLPQEIEEDTRPFRTLLATNISKEKANMNNLAEFFAKFGEMISLQLHKPGGRCLDEVRQGDLEHPGIVNTICAVVEYEKVHYARQALRFILNNPECNMKVIELLRKKCTTASLLSIKSQAEGESAYYSTSDVSEPTSPVCRTRPLHKLKSPYCSKTSSPSLSPIVRRRYNKHQQSSPESSPPSPYSTRRGPTTPCSSPEDRPYSSHEKYYIYPRYDLPGSSPLPRRQLTPRTLISSSDFNTRRCGNFGRNNIRNGENTPPAPLSPWLRRRINSGSTASSPSASPNLRRRQEASLVVPDNVTRLPKGPDGSRGFSRRPIIVNAQA